MKTTNTLNTRNTSKTSNERYTREDSNSMPGQQNNQTYRDSSRMTDEIEATKTQVYESTLQFYAEIAEQSKIQGFI